MSFYRELALKLKSFSVIFLLLIIGCSTTDTKELISEEIVVKGSFALPAYNGQCLYSQEEAVNELERLRQEESLDFEINIIYQTGPPECAGRVWGSNLAQGAKVDIDTSEIDLVVGKEDLNNLSREAELPNEYGRVLDLGDIETILWADLSEFQDYFTDIDYIEELESYLFVGHEKSQIIWMDAFKYGKTYVLTDLSKFVGKTENWETGLISIDVISTDGGNILFLASYTDKEIYLKISIFNLDISSGELRLEKDLFVSPQNGGEDTHHCGNIERFNENTWIFCVGDQDTLYALNENSIRTDLYSGKLIMFSLNEELDVISSSPPTPSYDPQIFTPVGGDIRPKAVLASPTVDSSFEIDHILALGFRNPWGFAVYENHIFVPDVGHNKVEEINLVDLESPEPKFFGWPHKEGDFFYAREKKGKFWDYEVSPIYQHSSEDSRCANIGGTVHKSTTQTQGWNGYFIFADQCTFEVFITNKDGNKVYRANPISFTSDQTIGSPPVVIKSSQTGETLISTYTGEIYMLLFSTLNLSP
jgi:hypothetical protein